MSVKDNWVVSYSNMILPAYNMKRDVGFWGLEMVGNVNGSEELVKSARYYRPRLTNFRDG